MRSPLVLLTGGLALIVIVVAAWLYLQPPQGADNGPLGALPFQGPASSSRTPQNTAISEGSVSRGATADDAAAAPQGEPQQTTAEAASTEPPLFEPLPAAVDALDDYILRQLRGPLQNPAAATLLTQDGIIDRSNTVFINLAKGQIARTHLPIAPAGGKFTVGAVDDAEVFTPAPENAQRYTPYVEAMESFDVQKLAAFYRLLSPQLENAYRQLGEPGSFHDAMMTAFDLLLATPDVDDAQLTLVRPKVMYQFQSPELEKLPPAQKLLLRMGSENRARVKNVIAQWRTQLRR